MLGKPSCTSDHEVVPYPSRRSRSTRLAASLVAIATAASLLTGCASDQSSIDRKAEPLGPVGGSTPSEVPSDAPLTWNTTPVEGGSPAERRELGAENSPGPFFEGRDVSTSSPTPLERENHQSE